MAVSFSPNLSNRIDKATGLIAQLGGSVVALSAGVDSSLVALLAFRALGDSAVAVTGVSESLPLDELDVAKRTAKSIGIRHLSVQTGELSRPEYSSNPQNRCYYCKETLYEELRAIADRLGFRSILDGTHIDDLGDDRPGLKAGREAGVISPLLECSFTKSEIREAARIMGLEVWDKPAMPCLSSRIIHGEEITVGKLEIVGKAESFIRRLTGVRNLRVRYNNSAARIEVPPEEMKCFFDETIMEVVDGELRRLGFVSVTLDLRGYRTKEKASSNLLVLPMANFSL